MSKGVAFDLEGTVVNVEPAHHGAWIRAAGEIGVTLASPQEAIEKIPNFIGGPDGPIIEQIFALTSERQKPSGKEAQRFLDRKWAHYDALLGEIDLCPRAGFLEVYGKLCCAGIPVVIGTAVDLDKGIVLLKRSGLAKLFTLHEIIMLTDVKNPKPAPDCFLETARIMGVRPEEQLVFEDSPRGVASGVAAGSRVIGMPVYDHPLLKQKLSEAGAKRIYTDWGQVDLGMLLTEF